MRLDLDALIAAMTQAAADAARDGSRPRAGGRGGRRGRTTAAPLALSIIATVLRRERSPLATLAGAWLSGELGPAAFAVELAAQSRWLAECFAGLQDAAEPAARAAMQVFERALKALPQDADPSDATPPLQPEAGDGPPLARAGLKRTIRTDARTGAPSPGAAGPMAPQSGSPRAAGARSRAGALRAPAHAPSPTPLTLSRRRLNARPDTPDFRDLLYVPTLVEVPTRQPPSQWLQHGVPVLDQGVDGACTGYALATVVHGLLRMRHREPDPTRVSARMLYAMARRHDEWPGEAYEGSSCRGAMKGWHRHGVCAESLWPRGRRGDDATPSEEAARDAHTRPLGAYFRVHHKDLVAMHAALAEVGVLFASATVHDGWESIGPDGTIRFDDDVQVQGGHAFAIVGYDDEGLWIQNSWGTDWGVGGLARIAYADWLQHGQDAWVARLGVPLSPAARQALPGQVTARNSRARADLLEALSPHLVGLGNDGRLREGGTLATTAVDLRQLLLRDVPRLTANWPVPRLVLYAHGGLVPADETVQRVSRLLPAMLAQHCHLLAFVWHSDLISTLRHVLDDALRSRRAGEGAGAGGGAGERGATREFMIERLDDALEPLARHLGGKALWDEMKENARAATERDDGGARQAAAMIAELAAARPELEIHLVGHSAGSVLLAPLLRLLTTPRAHGGLGLNVASCTLWAPACTMALFDSHYAPALEAGTLQRLALFTLTEHAEASDRCADVYHQSLLHLVSHALESRPRIPWLRPDGVPLLGLARDIRRHEGLARAMEEGRVRWIESPNAHPAGQPGASATAEHGGFDDDPATLHSTLRFIVGG